MGESIVADRGKWAACIEAIHDPTGDDQRWAERIWEAAPSLLRTSHGLGMTVTEHDDTCSTATYRALVLTGLEKLALPTEDAGLSALGVDGFRAFYYPSGLVATHLDVERGLPDELTAAPRRLRAAFGVADAVGVFAHARPGRIASLFALHDKPITLSRRERLVLTRLALHIEAAHRSRSNPEEVILAVVDADGRVLHREAEAPSATDLGAQVMRIEASDSPLEIWPALLSGRASLVRRRENGKLRYLLIENPPERQRLRAWTRRETETVTHAARGLSNKLVSYALGVPQSVVSIRLASAAAKVGFSSQTELLRIAAMLNRDPRAPFPEVNLTAAEREVLSLLQQGLSNQDIATARSRSLRTIANQVASLLRKSGSESRRELLIAPDAD